MRSVNFFVKKQLSYKADVFMKKIVILVIKLKFYNLAFFFYIMIVR